MAICYDAKHCTFTLFGGDVSYVLHVTEDGRLMNLYWGKRVADGAVVPQMNDYPAFVSFDLPIGWQPAELPSLGAGWYGTPALDVQNAAGDHVVDLRVKAHCILAGKPGLQGLPATYCELPEEAETLQISLVDEVIGLEATAQYTVFSKSGAMARSLSVRNVGEAALQLRGLMAASVPLWGSGYDVIHLKGAWAREREVIRTAAGQGEYRIGSQRGASGHESNPFLALCDRSATEQSGNVWSMNLIYSGSFLACAATDNANNSRLSIGLNPQVFSWLLQPGEIFQSPEAVLVFSDKGLNGMSQIYHKLYRTRLARGTWRDRVRPILVNNWEATYFDFDEPKILAIAEKAKELGIELFVLDDGWFGYRNSDNSSLGDWAVNLQKLPHGLTGLSEKLHQMQMMFGLWVEPEMISPDSDLYRAHPDWCLHAHGRSCTLERNQLILDLSRTEVQDYLITSMKQVLSSVDYVKWDMNRNMTEYFSEALPPQRQMETQHRYMLGLYRVLEEVTSAFPGVLFESCSGGGGRFDGGMLYYMPQAWTSDDTDAVSRLTIQYGTSLVYPVSSMGAHISAVPNHQCERTTSMQMRGDVALGGNLGFELDLTKLSAEDQKTARSFVEKAKALRGLTQQGTFYRLLSPQCGRHAAWEFVSADDNEALLCVYQVLAMPNSPPLRVKLDGLDPDKSYRGDDGRLYAGSVLMYMGISLTFDGDFSSRLIHFTVEESANG